MNVKVTWPQVAVVAIIVGALVTVTVTGQDANGIMLIGGAILAGLGLVAGKTEQVAKQTNGNASAQLELIRDQSRMLQELAHKLAEMQPPTGDDRPVSPAP